MSIACKIASFVVLIASIITGIVWGNISYDFSWGIFFSIAISGLLLFLIFFTLGEILDRVDSLAGSVESAAHTVRSVQKDLQSTEPKKTTNASSSYAKRSMLSDYWICKKCEHRNPQSARFCQNCGEHP